MILVYKNCEGKEILPTDLNLCVKDCSFCCLVSEEDARILWHRFKLLEPDDEGFISRDAFRKPPYSTNAFSKQVHQN